MSTHIDKAYVENALGKRFTAAAADTTTGATSSTVLTQLIQSASALVDSALRNAGYTPPTSTAPDFVKTATLGALIPLVYSRDQIPIPEGYQVYVDAYNVIRTGEMPVPGLTPNARDAVGGVKFAEASTGVSGSRPRVYSKLRDYY